MPSNTDENVAANAGVQMESVSYFLNSSIDSASESSSFQLQIDLTSPAANRQAQ